MVAYFKTQWFRLVIACVCLGLSLFYMFQPCPDLSTIEGIDKCITLSVTSISWLIGSIVWFFCSILDWHEDSIVALEKRIRDLEGKQESNNDI